MALNTDIHDKILTEDKNDVIACLHGMKSGCCCVTLVFFLLFDKMFVLSIVFTYVHCWEYLVLGIERFLFIVFLNVISIP